MVFAQRLHSLTTAASPSEIENTAKTDAKGCAPEHGRYRRHRTSRGLLDAQPRYAWRAVLGTIISGCSNISIRMNGEHTRREGFEIT